MIKKYGESVLNQPFFSANDMQQVLNENKSLKMERDALLQRNKVLEESKTIGKDEHHWIGYSQRPSHIDFEQCNCAVEFAEETLAKIDEVGK